MEKPLTRHIREDKRPLTLKEYEQTGGYQSVRKMLKEMTPKSVQSIVKESNLRGRGGAGFSTGLKWSFVPLDAPKPKYLVANGDEMEPGTFKDRLLLESTPHQLIEGMIVAAFAIQSDVSFIYRRCAYESAAQVILLALEEAKRAGYLGKHTLGSEFAHEMRLHTGVRSY